MARAKSEGARPFMDDALDTKMARIHGKLCDIENEIIETSKIWLNLEKQRGDLLRAIHADPGDPKYEADLAELEGKLNFYANDLEKKRKEQMKLVDEGHKLYRRLLVRCGRNLRG